MQKEAKRGKNQKGGNLKRKECVMMSRKSEITIEKGNRKVKMQDGLILGTLKYSSWSGAESCQHSNLD
jgi:hypothetical protein